VSSRRICFHYLRSRCSDHWATKCWGQQ